MLLTVAEDMATLPSEIKKMVLHGKLWDCNIVKKFNTGQASIADAMITDKETKSGRGGHRPPAIRAEQWLDL